MDRCGRCYGGQLARKNGDIGGRNFLSPKGRQWLAFLLDRFGYDALFTQLHAGNCRRGGQYFAFGFTPVAVVTAPNEYRILCCHFFPDLTLDDGRISQW